MMADTKVMSEAGAQPGLSPLQQMCRTATDYWNDSCSVQELTYGIEHGAVGATTNPQIVVAVLKKEGHLWHDRIREIIAENPTWSESEITWKLVEEMAVRGAALLEPVYHRYGGRKGRLSIQTNPQNYRNAEAIARQAIHFSTLAPNMQVKAPVTRAGVQAIEEATYAGVSVNATVCFTVPQTIAVGEAIDRGLARREAAGLDCSHMSPVCTLMVGRLDDWLKVVVKRDGIAIDPTCLDWAGIAAFKKTYRIFCERGYRARPLVAAYRHLGHWAEVIGGELVQTMPYEWALKANACDIPVISRIDNPVDPAIVGELYDKLPEFRRAYDEDGLTVDEFDGYGATVRTLRGFIAAVHELTGIVRDYMLPDPDVR